MASNKPNKVGSKTPNRQGMYAKIAVRSDELIDKMFKLTESRNENVAMGAIKVLINKMLPDLKATELSGKDGESLTVKIIRDYLSKPQPNATSTRSPEGQNKVQDADMAQEGKEN